MELVPEKRPPFSVRDAVNALVDVEIFGIAWVDWQGKRVDPRLVRIDNGVATANGRNVYMPSPVTFDFTPRPRRKANRAAEASDA